MRRPLPADIVTSDAKNCSAEDDSLEINFSGDRNSWDSFVSDINDALNPLDLELAHIFDEISGKEMCGLVSGFR